MQRLVTAGLCRPALLLLLLVSMGVAPLYAQEARTTGAIAGVVVDAANGESLPGANVNIKGTTTGTAADLNGRYRLAGLEPGTYDVVASFVGFAPKTITGVEVEAGETATIDFALQEQTAELDEVIVEAEAARDSDAGLLMRRAKAAAVSNAVSAEAISQAAASNAADAMEQVSGASVVGGKYVYVRGLGDRYSNTQLNNVELPTADPDKNSVQFDLFPSSLLENITTMKTFTPDMPGSFSGGLVNISTKSFPSDLSLQFSASASVNTQTHFGASDDFILYPGSSTDWLGFDDGSRGIPDALEQAASIPSLQDARTNPEDAQRLDALSRQFNSVMAPTRQSPTPVNQSYSLSLGNQAEVGGRPFGYVASLTYGRSASLYEEGTIGRYSFISSQSSVLATDLDVRETVGTATTDIGGLLNMSYQLTPNNEIGVNTLFSQSGESEAIQQEGRWQKEFNNPNDTWQSRALNYTERRLYSVQLRGEHYVPALGNSTFEWTGATSLTQQDEPDVRQFANLQRVLPNTEAPTDTAYIADNTNFDSAQRYFRNLDERSYNGKVDWSMPLPALFKGAGDAKLKAGAAMKYTDRAFRERNFEIRQGSPEGAYNGDPRTYFGPENTGIIGQDANGRPIFGAYVDDNTDRGNNYEGDRTVLAGYGMLEVPVTSRLRVIGGLRIETTDITVESGLVAGLRDQLSDPDLPSEREAGLRDQLSNQIADIGEVDLLPSVNVVYALQDNMNLRAAASQTLARPTFREVAPFERRVTISDNFVIGNPNLTRSLILNADVRWEWFMRPGEILAVSVFGKRLQDPIERTIIGGTNGQVSFANVGEAQVYGVEIEADKRLDILHPALANFSVGGNLSLTESQIDIPCEQFGADGLCDEGELAVKQNIDPNTPTTRDLQGQSAYLFNADLTYQNPEIGSTASVRYNVYGERLSNVAQGQTPDVFEQPRPQLDVTYSQRLLDHWSAKVSVKNVLNSDVEFTQTLPGGRPRIYERYTTGRSISVGVSYDL